MSTTLADAAKSAPGEAVTAAMLTMAAQLDEAVKAAGHGLLALAQAAVGAESAAHAARALASPDRPRVGRTWRPWGVDALARITRVSDGSPGLEASDQTAVGIVTVNNDPGQYI